MAEFSRILKQMHQKYSEKLARETEQKRLLVALIKKHGRVKFKQGGSFYEWRIRYKEHPFIGIDDMEVLEWQREDTYKIALLPWREVAVKDVISKREIKLARGRKEQILNIYDDKMETLNKDFINGFSDNLWLDGNATGNTKKFHGLESIFADDNLTVDGDEFAKPADSYAGLSTAEGAFGNPAGDPGERAFSPTLVNSGFGGSNWAASADKILRKAILRTQFGNSPDLRVTFITCVQRAYRELLDLMASKERIVIEKGESNEITRLGFSAVDFEGVPLTWEFGMPASPANPAAKTLDCYGLNVNGMLLAFCGEVEDMVEGNVYFDEDQRAYKMICESLGNLIIREPRLQFKVAAYA